MIVSLSKFNSRRLSLPSETESKKRSMIKELRVDYRKCFTNSALSSTAKRFSPSTLQCDFRLSRWRIQLILESPLRFLRLPDHLVRPRQYVRRNRHADLVSGFQVDDEFKLCRLLDGQIFRFCSFENFI